jgi:purine-binding chemotaxis protein CheW
VVFAIDGRRFALPLSKVDRVLRVVEITRLPDTSETILGVINMHGQVVPVVDLRKLWGFPIRDIELSDQLIIVTSATRTLALLVDRADVIRCASANIVSSETILPGFRKVPEVVKQDDGVLPILELDALLSAGDERALAATMKPDRLYLAGGTP